MRRSGTKGNWAFPHAINNSKVAVGQHYSFSDTTYSSNGYEGWKIFWPDNSTSLLTTERWWGATSLNNAPTPQIVGYSKTNWADTNVKAIMWVKVNGTWKYKNLGRYNASSGSNAEVSGWASKITDRFEILGSFGLWRNGNIRTPSQILNTNDWVLTSVWGINNSGVMIGDANKKPGNNPRTVLLVPADIAVDANRDGTIRFAGNFQTTQGKPTDKTTEAKPFRFWCNDDDDFVGTA